MALSLFRQWDGGVKGLDQECGKFTFTTTGTTGELPVAHLKTIVGAVLTPLVGTSWGAASRGDFVYIAEALGTASPNADGIAVSGTSITVERMPNVLTGTTTGTVISGLAVTYVLYGFN